MVYDSVKKIIILFDEHGTPIFKMQKEQDIFLGVSVLYELNEEEIIFNCCDEIMGLSNSNPLKNNKISVSRAINISKTIGNLNLDILGRYLRLDNSRLKDKTEEYVKFGNFTRKIFRKTNEERKLAQVLYQEVLYGSLWGIIEEYLKHIRTGIHSFEIFIDSWDFPNIDRYFAQEYASGSLEEKLRTNIKIDSKRNTQISISPIRLLTKSSDQRKRFIDVMTSIISRAFRNKHDSKFSVEPLRELKNRLKSRIRIIDDSDEVVQFMDTFIKKSIRDTKEKDKGLLIL